MFGNPRNGGDRADIHDAPAAAARDKSRPGAAGKPDRREQVDDHHRLPLACWGLRNGPVPGSSHAGVVDKAPERSQLACGSHRPVGHIRIGHVTDDHSRRRRTPREHVGKRVGASCDTDDGCTKRGGVTADGRADAT